MHGVKCKFWHRWMSIDIDHGKMCELDPKMAWNRIVWRWGFLFLVYWRVPGLDRHCLHYCSGPVSQSIDWYGRFIWLNCVRAGKPLFRCDFLFCFFSTTVCWPIMHWSSGQIKMDIISLGVRCSIRRHINFRFSHRFLVFGVWWPPVTPKGD